MKKVCFKSILKKAKDIFIKAAPYLIVGGVIVGIYNLECRRLERDILINMHRI